MKIRDGLTFVPLGGTGEIGMNLNLYGYKENGEEAWIIVDVGVMFGDDATPGIDRILADTAFIEQRRDKLKAIILTHAHQDHIGALGVLWPRLRCPVYASPFTAAFAQHVLREGGLEGDVPLHTIPASGQLDLGLFSVDFLGLTHSIPEMNALILRTPAGVVFHTGDWKFDADPLIGAPVEEDALRQLGEEGVMAVICDSTNALEEGVAGSEAEVRKALHKTIAACRKGRIFVTAFASNIARLESAAHAAHASGRRVALVGRSMQRMAGIAEELGMFRDIPPFLDEKEGMSLPPEKALFLCTGSQGEPNAALMRLAQGSYPSRLRIAAGDTVIFSSRKIPGNEKAIGALINALTACDANVITAASNASLHVSGHPAREELKQLYHLLRPRVAIPVHGELRHMRAHATLAQTCQVPQTLIARNGSIISFTGKGAHITGEAQNGRMYLDGALLTRSGNGSALNQRVKLGRCGIASVSLVLDAQGEMIDDPQFSLSGVPEGEKQEIDHCVFDAIFDALASQSSKDKRSDDVVREVVRRYVRRALRGAWGKMPQMHIHIFRV